MLRNTSLSPKLVIAGGKGWMMDDFFSLLEEKGLTDRVCLTGYLQDEELVRALLELHGVYLPVALRRLRTAAARSDGLRRARHHEPDPALMETVGNAARLVDPKDVDDIAHAMTKC